MKYLLDTDISSYYLRGKNNLLAIFEQKGFQNIRISRATVAELEVLANRNPASKINFSTINQFVQRVGILEIDTNTWKIFSKLKAEMLNQHKQKGDFDILLTSVAQQHDLTVITNNASHFQDLIKFENWIAS